MASSTDATIVFNGSYAVLACMSGYVNTGGSLNVTCLNNGSWTQFPNCVLSSGSITTTTTSIPNQLSTTTIAPNTGAACSIDSTTFTITNGYYASSTLSYTSATTVTGKDSSSTILFRSTDVCVLQGLSYLLARLVMCWIRLLVRRILVIMAFGQLSLVVRVRY